MTGLQWAGLLESAAVLEDSVAEEFRLSVVIPAIPVHRGIREILATPGTL
jgi:hypothetical protein